MMKTIEFEYHGHNLVIETGKLAKQAHGAVTIRYGDTIVLATAVSSNKIREGTDFLPLVCDYLEKTYAAGKIPGGFFKREGRPSEKEILTSRFIDRTMRPLFPKGYRYDSQIIAYVLSTDQENESDVLAITAASAALHISEIPFDGPVAGVRVGRIDGEFKINPTQIELESCDMNLIVASKENSIVMVEGWVDQASEEDVADAILFARDAVQPLIQAQKEMREALGVPKREFVPPETDQELLGKVRDLVGGRILDAVQVTNKKERKETVDVLRDEAIEKLDEPSEDGTDRKAEIKEVFYEVQREAVRGMILRDAKRIDGRGYEDIREITCEVGLLPRTHGSALFTRGETQALVVVTLGTSEDEQRLDNLLGETSKTFMLHYNFPPFSVGEFRMLRGPARREIGHGALAERSIKSMLPAPDDFPYTVRIVSDILESNGSSSMATVCGGILSLMDAGVPISAPIAGIAMGLIKENDQVAILTDILGDEDHLGDMDFKVAGSRKGLTSLQMDIKIDGLDGDTLRRALLQARDARMKILDKMEEALPEPRAELSPYAPRISIIYVNPDRIKDVIGPGGKHIKALIEETGVKIDVEDSGKITIASPDADASKKAIMKIRKMTEEPEVGKYYMGKVRTIKDFGAFVEIIPGMDGLVHISQLAEGRVNRVTDVLREGDEILVKVLEIDRNGKIRLSRKDALGKKLEDFEDQIDE